MNEQQEKELKESLIQKIVSNENIIELMNIFNERYSSTKLVGGAIIDILENRIPKDFDLINASKELLLNNGYIFKYSTKTAETYEKNGIVVQILNTSIESFDYKISQTTFVLEKKELTIDTHSFLNKDLVPVGFESKQALNSLRRLPHWKNKGYSINDNTYHSLLNSACKIYLDKKQINS